MASALAGVSLALVVLATTLVGVGPVSATSTVTLLGRPVFPAALSQNVPLVRVTFTRPVNAHELTAVKSSPALSVKWQQIGADEVQAVATSTLVPDTTYTLNVPVHFRCRTTCVAFGYQRHTATVNGSELWAQELLAKLDYLPVKFTPTSARGGITGFVPGTFTWKFPKLPSALKSQWRTGADSTIMWGALKRFQSENNLEVTGELDATTWATLLHAVAHLTLNATPYDYVYVSTTLPETLSLYRNGNLIYQTPVNTGIAAAPTAPGTFAVYARFLVTTMTGTEPDGQKYSDPGIPWVSYFNGGDALHGFIRSSYGWPQSLGCVEMPFANAEHVFPYTPIGTLVTIS